MSSRWIDSLRSVELDVPDLQRARDFYTRVWHLDLCHETAQALYFRGTGADDHLLALRQAPVLALRSVTLRARSPQALGEICRAAAAAGGTVLQEAAALDEPGGGVAVRIADRDGRIYRVVHGDARRAPTEVADRPVRLAHAVLNSHDIPGAQAFLEQALDFRLIDRTRIMAFMNCDRDHHTIAFGDADNDALNHIAFLMPDLDSVMRGGGRMKDAGHAIEWGPGRHGPGHNAFNYFVGPFGEVIEYTADVEQIDDSYEAHQPEHWRWPPGRVDQWGISTPPSERLKQAQRRVFFAAPAARNT